MLKVEQVKLAELDVRLLCGCLVRYGVGLEMCPLHAQAPAMRETLTELVDMLHPSHHKLNDDEILVYDKARALLAQIEKGA